MQKSILQHNNKQKVIGNKKIFRVINQNVNYFYTKCNSKLVTDKFYVLGTNATSRCEGLHFLMEKMFIRDSVM